LCWTPTACCRGTPSNTTLPTGRRIRTAARLTADLSTIPNALWTWAPGIDGTSHPSELAQYYFSKRIRIHGRPLFGKISVSADDFAEVRVNGAVVGSVGSTTDPVVASEAQSALTTFGRPAEPPGARPRPVPAPAAAALLPQPGSVRRSRSSGRAIASGGAGDDKTRGDDEREERS
jgi:hypothetical protein